MCACCITLVNNNLIRN